MERNEINIQLQKLQMKYVQESKENRWKEIKDANV